MRHFSSRRTNHLVDLVDPVRGQVVHHHTIDSKALGDSNDYVGMFGMVDSNDYVGMLGMVDSNDYVGMQKMQEINNIYIYIYINKYVIYIYKYIIYK